MWGQQGTKPGDRCRAERDRQGWCGNFRETWAGSSESTGVGSRALCALRTVSWRPWGAMEGSGGVTGSL